MQTELKTFAVLGVILLGACVSTSPASSPMGSQIATASASAAASDARPDLDGRIVFIRPQRDSFFDEGAVFTANADGTNERELPLASEGCCLFVTRDGDRVLVSALAADGRVTTVTANFDGSDQFVVPLPPSLLYLGPGPFSPDGSRIAFEGSADDAHLDMRGIYIGATDGTNLVQLTHDLDIPGDWSPDGTQVLVMRDPDHETPGPDGLFIVNVDGSGEHQLTPDEITVLCCWGYHWSPDGSRILFANQDGILWLINPDGSDLTQLFVDDTVSHVRRSVVTPNWSPDGTQIIFALSPSPSNFDPAPNGLYVIEADGTGLTLAIGDNTFKREPYWVP